MAAALAMLNVSLLLGGCGAEEDSEAPTSTTGVSLIGHLLLPEDSDTAEISASVYFDSSLWLLVGGDLFQVSNNQGDNGQTQAYLTADEGISGYYEGSLEGVSPDDNITLEIVFDPEQARAERWYPTDTLSVETEPGPMVGYSGRFLFPDAINITSPQPNTRYLSKAETVSLAWDAGNADPVNLIIQRDCLTNRERLQWSSQQALTDDGFQELSLQSILPNDGNIDTSSELTGDLVLALFGYILEVVTLGLIDLDLESPKNLSDYSLIDCDIEMTLIRSQNGELGDNVEGGQIVASRSDSVSLEYRP